jgi:transcriptional regulator with XRE-family HTH domain
MIKMTLKQSFVSNMKEFRKKEGLSQMKLAEYLNTSPTYIGEIEVGKKFPSMDMIEKIAGILRIKPYHFFIDRTEENTDYFYPKLPKSMQKEIRNKLNFSMNDLIEEILSEY